MKIETFDDLIPYSLGIWKKKKYMSYNFNWREMLSICYTAYLKAIDEFKPEKGSFKTLYKFKFFKCTLVELKNKLNIVYIPTEVYFGWRKGIDKIQPNYEYSDYFNNPEIECYNDCRYDFRVSDCLNINKFLDILTDKEKYVIKTLYGIELEKKDTVCLSKELGVTQQAISIMHMRSLNKLKKYYKKEKII